MTATTDTPQTYTVTCRRQHVCVKFEDLPEPLKSHVLNQYGYDEVSYDWWDMELDWFCDDISERYGIAVDGKRCYFSLWPTWGTWTFSHIENIDKLMDAMGITDKRERDFLNYWEGDAVRFDSAPTHREQCQHSSLEWWTMEEDEVTDPATLQGMNEEAQEQFLSRVERAWDNLCSDIAHELGRLMEQQYDYLTSEQYLRERMEENGEIFDIETGEVFHIDDADEAA